MAGLESIISSISQEAKANVNKIQVEAQAQSSEIIENANENIRKQIEELQNNSYKELEDIEKRAVSTAELKKRQNILKLKQELIGDTIDKAKAYIYGLPDLAYFEFLEKLLKRYISGKNSVELGFSKKDLDRMTADIVHRMNKVAEDNNASLKIRTEPVDIEGGFIIYSNNIEENCSIVSLFDDNYEVLQDKVSTILFH